MVEISPEQLYQTILRDLSCTSLHLDSHKESDMDSRSVAATLLKSSIVKKWRSGNAASRRAAIKLFREVNEAVPIVFDGSGLDDEVATAIGEGRRFLFDMFPQNRMLCIPEQYGGFGPGVTLGCESNLASKLMSELTYCGKTALIYWRKAAFCSPTAWDLELIRSKQCGEREVRIGKLTTVPKNSLIDRVICVEPTANAFLQQGIRRVLEHKLHRMGINLSTQPTVQRRLAYEGSISGGFATIDLSSASDTIGHAFCRYYLPPDLFWWLDEARTPSVAIDGDTVELNMMSSMGNATTFPLQTLIFASLVKGVYSVLNLPFSANKRRGSRTVGVFGDDIIVLSKAYDLLVRVLNACGFKVNPDKSFSKGFFRESCGGDYHLGLNVRGVYIKSLKGRNDLYVARNLLRDWSKRHLVPLPHTMRLLEQSVKRPHWVPEWDNDDAGFKTSDGTGWYKASRPIPSQRKLCNDDSNSSLLHNLALAGCIEQDCDAFVRISTRARKVVYKDRRSFAFSFSTKPCVLPFER